MPFRTQFDHTLTLETVIAGSVFIIVLLGFGFGIVRYRARPGRVASQRTEHPRLEAAVAVVLFAAALAIVLVTRQATATDQASRPATVEVQVTGFQWCWRFHYVSSPVTVTGSCEAGRHPTLVVPAGEPVKFDTTSSDVIHSFWVPAFRVKLDAFPDHVNSFVMTVPHPGTWTGHCAEFCGEDHAFMTFRLRAVPVATFESWLATPVGASTLPA
jgi:cytochrome c oxidase subunit 2